MQKKINYYYEILKKIQKIPTIGPKASERIFDSLLLNKENIDLLVDSLTKIKDECNQCNICFTLQLNKNCLVCDNKDINTSQICIVANICDYFTLVKSELFKGSYHVLNGEINMKKNMTPEKLTIKHLVNRLKNNQNIEEVIFALNTTFEGEVTLTYIKKIIQDKFPKIKMSRISQGLPLGGMIEYIDEFTLQRAIYDRKKI